MPDVLSFWLDNKMVSAHKVVELHNQTLVDYRNKFYVVENGAAVMKGGRPLHYSKTSLPTLWKKALRGELVEDRRLDHDDCALPMMSKTSRNRKMKPVEEPVMSDALSVIPSGKEAVGGGAAAVAKRAVPAKKQDIKPVAPHEVLAHCPYCNQKQDIPFERGRNGKPFFHSCIRCSVDFAVRFVPVTVFQAQVAGFK